MTARKDFIYDETSGTTVMVDARVFSDCVAEQISLFKIIASEEILKRYPEHKQRNAALGILTAAEMNTIREGIDSIRSYCDSLEAQVNAVSWDGTEGTRAAACDAVQSVRWNYTPSASPPPQRFTAYEFLTRFTAQERASFRAAAAGNPIVADFQQLAQAAQEVIVTDPTTVAGMAYLVSVGLLTQQRSDEILGIQSIK